MVVSEDSGRRSGPSSTSVRWLLPQRDAWPTATRVAFVGLAAAVMMAFLGLPPVDLHGLAHRFGVMDPLCGGTRAVRLAAMGQWAASWSYNPIGIPLVLGSMALLLRAGIGWLTGRWVEINIVLSPRARRAVQLGALLGVVLLGVNQQLHAALLLGTG